MLEIRSAHDPFASYIYSFMKQRGGFDLMARHRDVMIYKHHGVRSDYKTQKNPFPYFSPEDLARLRKPDALAIIDWSGEGVPGARSEFTKIFDWCAEHGIDSKRIVWISQNPVGYAVSQSLWSKENGKPLGVRFGFAHSWMDWTIESAARVPSTHMAEMARTRKTARFLMLNNAPRLNRVLVASLLLELCGEEALVSLSQMKEASLGPDAPGNDRTMRAALDPLLTRLLGHPPLREKFARLFEDYDPIATSARATLPSFSRSILWDFDEALYRRSLVSIVGETDFMGHLNYRFTEKTIKPLLFGHPLLVVGNPFVLEQLQRMGFETFPEIFDERYDALTYPEVRLDAILDNICALAAEPFSVLEDKVASVADKIRYNHEYATRVVRHRYADWLGRHLTALIEGAPGITKRHEIMPFTAEAGPWPGAPDPRVLRTGEGGAPSAAPGAAPDRSADDEKGAPERPLA